MISGSPVPQILSKVLESDRIRPAGLHLDYAPDMTERAALASALGLAAIDTFSVRFELQRRGRKVHVKGTLTADVDYICVVSLDAFPARISEPFSVMYEEVARSRNRGGSSGEIEVPLDDDAPEPIENGKIDLGAIAQEFLALALDPYPRKPGASLSETVPDEAETVPSAFSRLAALLPDKSGKKH